MESSCEIDASHRPAGATRLNLAAGTEMKICTELKIDICMRCDGNLIKNLKFHFCRRDFVDFAGEACCMKHSKMAVEII